MNTNTVEHQDALNDFCENLAGTLSEIEYLHEKTDKVFKILIDGRVENFEITSRSNARGDLLMFGCKGQVGAIVQRFQKHLQNYNWAKGHPQILIRRG